MVWQVDDLKLLHKDEKEVTDVIEWLKSEFKDKEIVKVKVSRWKKHNFLGMNFYFSDEGKVRVSIKEYVQDMIDTFPSKIDKTATTPAALHSFKTINTVKLEENEAGKYHTITAKGIFLCKRARTDIQTTSEFLTTSIKKPDKDDWKKLQKLLQYLNGTKDLDLILKANHLNILNWYIDTSHHIHPDFRSHTGGTMTMGKGGVYNNSIKQKLNTKSSTESELVTVDDMMPHILWTNTILKAQGFTTNDTIIYQGNKSAIEKNGRMSSNKKTKHIGARYNFIRDYQEHGLVTVDNCPTDDIIEDIFTKPLKGGKFQKFRKFIMNS